MWAYFLLAGLCATLILASYYYSPGLSRVLLHLAPAVATSISLRGQPGEEDRQQDAIRISGVAVLIIALALMGYCLLGQYSLHLWSGLAGGWCAWGVAVFCDWKQKGQFDETSPE